jgi:hypothetical protein
MRKIPLYLLLVALSIATYLFATSRGEGVSQLTSGPDSQTEIVPEALPDGLPALESAALSREPLDQVALGGLSGVARIRSVMGEVAVPPACASKEELFIYAWSEEVSHEFVQSMSSTEIGDSIDSGAILLGSSPVEPSGRFQFEFMTALEEVHLFALGKFTYSESSSPTLLGERENETFLTTLCGGRVRGQIEGLKQEDPAEIRVKLTTSKLTINQNSAAQQRLTRETSLSEDGSFDFVAVPTGRELNVQVQPKLMAPASLEVKALREGEDRLLMHSLQAGGGLSGRVVDPSGAPVANAQIKTTGGRAAIALMGWAEGSAETNESGEFSITGLPAGRVMIAAKKEGYLDSGWEPIELLAGETKEDLELKLSAGNSLFGSVRWPDGEASVGAEVTVSFDRAALLGAESINSARGADGQAITDSEGTFRVKALGNGPFTVSVSHTPTGARLESWLTEETQLTSLERETELEDDVAFQWTASLTGVRPDSADLELSLEAPVVLSGITKNDLGEAITDYEVVLVRLEDSALGSIGVETRKHPIHDAEGRFIVAGVSAGTWHVYAIADGYSRPEPVLINIPRELEAETLLFLLELSCTVSGVILNPSGAPLQGGLVRIKTALSPMISSLSTDLAEPTATSGSAGDFSLSGLRSGEVELVASAVGYAASAPLPLTLVAGEELARLRLKLRLGCTITGVLYNEEGEFASGATVQVMRPSDYSTQLTSTDGEGSFQVDNLEPGSWQVIGLPNLLDAISGDKDSSGGRADMMKGIQIQLVELADGDKEHVILGEPPADPVRMWGVVTHHKEALQGATLVMIAEGRGGFPKIAATDTEGRYEMTLDEPGDYQLTIQRTNGSYTEQQQCSFRVQVPSTTDYQHDAELPDSIIRGQVRLESGEPAAHAPISLTPNSDAGFSVFQELTNTIITCSEDGSFSIDGVMPGSYRLRAGGVGYIQRMLASSGELTAPHGQSSLAITVNENQLIDNISLVLPEAGEITVRVIDASGAPVEGATIFIRHEDGTPAEEFAVASTDTKGHCSYQGLSEGNYQVSARTAEQASPEGALVRVQAGAASQIELQLESGTLLTVSTVDGEGEPVAANLRVIDSDGRDHASYFSVLALQKRMGAEGLSRSKQVIGPLSPGRYRVYAISSDGKSEDKPVNLRGQSERAVKIRFR